MGKCRRICIACKRFRLSTADYGYSEYTPGTQFNMSCDKNHWDFDPYRETEDTFREKLLTAKNCEDFKFYKDDQDENSLET